MEIRGNCGALPRNFIIFFWIEQAIKEKGVGADHDQGRALDR